MFENYSKEEIERISNFLEQMKKDNITQKTLTRDYCNKYLSKEDYIIFKNMLEEYKEQKENKKQEFQININEFNSNSVLCIEEKEYTKEELLITVGKRINFYKSLNLSKDIEDVFINDVLDAYNEIMKSSKKYK